LKLFRQHDQCTNNMPACKLTRDQINYNLPTDEQLIHAHDRWFVQSDPLTQKRASLMIIVPLGNNYCLWRSKPVYDCMFNIGYYEKVGNATKIFNISQHESHSIFNKMCALSPKRYGWVWMMDPPNGWTQPRRVKRAKFIYID